MKPQDQERLEKTVALIGHFHHDEKKRKELISIAVRLMRPPKSITVEGVRIEMHDINNFKAIYTNNGKLECCKAIKAKYDLPLVGCLSVFSFLSTKYNWKVTATV